MTTTDDRLTEAELEGFTYRVLNYKLGSEHLIEIDVPFVLKVCRAARAYLTAAKDGGWRPIASAPKDGTWIIGKRGFDVRGTQWGKTSHVPLYGWCIITGDGDGDPEYDLWKPTHWIPQLPALSEQIGEEDDGRQPSGGFGISDGRADNTAVASRHSKTLSDDLVAPPTKGGGREEYEGTEKSGMVRPQPVAGEIPSTPRPTPPVSDDVAGMIERLRHAATTASNDDESAIGTEKRRRHVERVDVMLEAAALLQSLSEQVAEVYNKGRNSAFEEIGNYAIIRNRV